MNYSKMTDIKTGPNADLMTNDPKTAVNNTDFAAYLSQAAALRRALHEIPEPSMEEHRTKAALMAFLSEHTRLTLHDMGSWFYAVHPGAEGAPTLAFRADFDAVTDADGHTRHLCGHDGHAAALCALALWLTDRQPDARVILLFQPGEETGEGARLCKELFRSEHVDRIYAFHNIPGEEMGAVLLRSGTFACASAGLSVRYVGSMAHAAYPEQGSNPAEALAMLILTAARYGELPHKGLVRSTVIGMELGSRSFGVSAGEGTLRLTYRAEKAEEFDRFRRLLLSLAKEQAEQCGLTAEITEQDVFTATVNHPAAVKSLRSAAKAAGLKVKTLKEPFRWSEDFGQYLSEAPGAMSGIGAGTDTPPLHTGCYEYPDGVTEAALRMFTALIEGA